VAKEDAAAPFGNKDAAVTIQKPVLLGGGFCTISSSRTSSPAAFALLGLAALALFRRRRSR
jgi:MYXO-CTERM domain-containing protein